MCMCTFMPGLAAQFVPCRSCTCSALRRASRAVTQHYERAFRNSGLRATQFTLLATLIQTGPLPLGRLASIAGLERTTLTRNLGPLERRGLVRSLPAADGRVRPVAITEEGEHLALTLLPAWQRAEAGVARVLEGMPGVVARIAASRQP